VFDGIQSWTWLVYANGADDVLGSYQTPHAYDSQGCGFGTKKSGLEASTGGDAWASIVTSSGNWDLL
jgi:hypothetical protein